MDQDNSFNVENYIAPGAYLRISDTSEDNKLWKVFFTVSKNNYIEVL